MSLKPTTLASMLMALTGILSVVGCSGDECTKAADHFTECMPLSSSISGGFDTTAQCDGMYLCNSKCFNAASCDAIVEAVSGNASDDHGGVAVIKCTTACTKQ